MAKICKRCNKEYDVKEKKCPVCGGKLETKYDPEELEEIKRQNDDILFNYTIMPGLFQYINCPKFSPEDAVSNVYVTIRKVSALRPPGFTFDESCAIISVEIQWQEEEKCQ